MGKVELKETAMKGENVLQREVIALKERPPISGVSPRAHRTPDIGVKTRGITTAHK